MTVQYTPMWNDGLTHADADAIRRDGLDWATQWLADHLAEYDAAHAAVLASLVASPYEPETYQEHAMRRDFAARSVVSAARALLNAKTAH